MSPEKCFPPSNCYLLYICSSGDEFINLQLSPNGSAGNDNEKENSKITKLFVCLLQYNVPLCPFCIRFSPSTRNYVLGFSSFAVGFLLQQGIMYKVFSSFAVGFLPQQDIMY